MMYGVIVQLGVCPAQMIRAIYPTISSNLFGTDDQHKELQDVEWKNMVRRNIQTHPHTNGIKYHVLFLASRNRCPTAMMPKKTTKTALAAVDGSYLKNDKAESLDGVMVPTVRILFNVVFEEVDRKGQVGERVPRSKTQKSSVPVVDEMAMKTLHNVS